jgi:uncharacterized protein (DUF2342 family)
MRRGRVREGRSTAGRRSRRSARPSAVTAQCRGGPVPWRPSAVAAQCRGGPVPWRPSAVAAQCCGAAHELARRWLGSPRPLASVPTSHSVTSAALSVPTTTAKAIAYRDHQRREERRSGARKYQRTMHAHASHSQRLQPRQQQRDCGAALGVRNPTQIPGQARTAATITRKSGWGRPDRAAASLGRD